MPVPVKELPAVPHLPFKLVFKDSNLVNNEFFVGTDKLLFQFVLYCSSLLILRVSSMITFPLVNFKLSAKAIVLFSDKLLPLFKTCCRVGFKNFAIPNSAFCI